MDESEFHRLADHWLNTAMDALEDADKNASLEVECENGALTIELPTGQIFIVSKHTPSRQLWLSSPLSGGLHFSFSGGQWSLADGRNLSDVLSQELATLTTLMITLP